ncbi:MAG: thiamine diphosphokinase [Oscillospiraceae bacterium]|nr:thiamine diphosphokinase [Oscillospiraceae bacterium]
MMESHEICAIFAGGPENGIPCLPVPAHAFCLCADSGLRLCERLGRRPDLVLGDFDSLGNVPEQLPHMTVPVEKDDTDTLLAARTALEKGYRDIRIYGAFGGRLDHTLANLQTLEFLLDAGAEGCLVSSENYAFLQRGGSLREYPRIGDFSFSVFAWSERCTGVTLTGTYYPLENGVLTRSFPLGVSNRITAETASVRVREGTLLIIGSRL